ncbi:MAG: hypothetical protein FJZ67_07525 [Bacteroidetes bacterium]|nr:hypothetical protein [Bacteroidota bacterium]
MELVSLKSLIFNSYDDHAEMVIDIKKASLSYSTKYLIDVLNINRILNIIKKNNPDLDLNESIRTIEFEDFQEFSLNLKSLSDCFLPKDEIDFMVVNSMTKQIRA